MVWWAWSAYTWLTNAVDVESIVTRLIVLVAMTGALFMALAVPDAYQDEAAWFAVAYFVVRAAVRALQLGNAPRSAGAPSDLALAPGFSRRRSWLSWEDSWTATCARV